MNIRILGSTLGLAIAAEGCRTTPLDIPTDAKFAADAIKAMRDAVDQAVGDQAMECKLVRSISTNLNEFDPRFESEIIAINFEITQESHVVVVVLDTDRNIVRHLLIEQLSAGKHTVVWNGHTDNDVVVRPGRYELRVEAKTGECEQVLSKVVTANYH